MGFLTSFFSNAQNTIIVVLATLLLGLGTAGFIYYKITDHNMAVLNQNQAKLQTSFDLQTKTITALQQQAAQQAAMLTDLQNQQQAAETEVKNTTTKINKLPITNISKTDNRAASDLANAASASAFSDLRNVTTKQ